MTMIVNCMRSQYYKSKHFQWRVYRRVAKIIREHQKYQPPTLHEMIETNTLTAIANPRILWPRKPTGWKETPPGSGLWVKKAFWE